MIDDSWFTVQKIDSMTFAISEYGHWEKVHSFLLLGESKAVLIDTGLGIDNIKRITNQLTNLPISVVTTHVHWDHIGSHGEFENISVHENDVEWLRNGIQGLPIKQIRKDVGRDISKNVPTSFNPANYNPYQGEATSFLKDGDMINLGNRKLIIYHTPGHSPGHICIFDQSYGYLFTGDLLYDETPIYANYPSTNPVDLINSLKKISKLKKVKMVYGSHNTLGLEPSILNDVKEAIVVLEKKDLIKFGTGLHEFNKFSFLF